MYDKLRSQVRQQRNNKTYKIKIKIIKEESGASRSTVGDSTSGLISPYDMQVHRNKCETMSENPEC